MSKIRAHLGQSIELHPSSVELTPRYRSSRLPQARSKHRNREQEGQHFEQAHERESQYKCLYDDALLASLHADFEPRPSTQEALTANDAA